MLGVTRAMLWELWRLSRWELGMRLFVQLSFASILLVTATNDPGKKDIISSIMFLMLLISSTFSSTWLNQLNQLDSTELGFNFRLGFTRPVSTTQLVLLPMLFLIATAVLNYVLIAWLLVTFVGLELSLFAPAITIACLIACLVSVVWSFRSLVGRYAGIAATLTAFVGTAIHFVRASDGYDPVTMPVPLLALNNSEVFQFGVQHVSLLVFMSTLAIVCCVFSVRAQRIGESSWLGESVKLLVDNFVGKPSAPFCAEAINTFNTNVFPRKAASLWRAMAWRHWKQAGTRIALVMVALPLLIALAVTIKQLMDPNWSAGPRIWLVSLFTIPFAYQIAVAEWLKTLRHTSGITELPIFDAVRPVRGDLVIANKLATVAALSICGWLLMAMCAMVQSYLAGDIPFWQQLGRSLTMNLTQITWYDRMLITCSFVAMMILNSAATIGIWLTMPLTKPIVSFVGAAITMALLIVRFLSGTYGWEIGWFWDGCQLVAGVAILVAACAAVCAAINRRSFGAAYGIASLAICIAAWAGLVRLAMLVTPLLTSLEVSTSLRMIAVISGASLSVLCMVLPPLAFSLHRHR